MCVRIIGVLSPALLVALSDRNVKKEMIIAKTLWGSLVINPEGVLTLVNRAVNRAVHRADRAGHACRADRAT